MGYDSIFWQQTLSNKLYNNEPLMEIKTNILCYISSDEHYYSLKK